MSIVEDLIGILKQVYAYIVFFADEIANLLIFTLEF